MPKAFIRPTCGLATTVHAAAPDMQRVTFEVESECAAIRKIAEALPEVDPFQEISRRGEGSRLLAAGRELCSHTSCPVPVTMIKVAEVAAGLDLPKEVVIEITAD